MIANTQKTLLEPLYNTEKIRQSLELKQERQKFFYNQHAKPIELLTMGERAGIKDHKTGIWIPATVTQQPEQTCSYKVESDIVEYR